MCWPSVFSSFPEVDQIRANPSYDPVANRVPLLFQSSDVTSLLLGIWQSKMFEQFLRLYSCNGGALVMEQSSNDSGGGVGLKVNFSKMNGSS